VGKGYTRKTVGEWFSQHGLLKTIESYGNDLNSVPESHREFFRMLLPYWQEENFIASHSWWLDDLLPKHLDSNFYTCVLWNGYTNEDAKDPEIGMFHDKKLFHGHTPVRKFTGKTDILIAGNKVFVDGGLSINPDAKLLVASLDGDIVTKMSFDMDLRDV
jgi:hypothetical protein